MLRVILSTRLGRVRTIGALLALCGLLAACPQSDENFSQASGFAEWYAARPPSDSLPEGEDRALLWRYKPRVFLPEGHEGPLDFYVDYIAHGRLYDGRPRSEEADPRGALIADQVTQELLNEHRQDPKVVFEHRPPAERPEPRRVIYGRVDHDRLLLPGCSQPVPLTFLTYHLVFRQSGVPAGLSAWQAFLLGQLADLDDWHQLDHYTAVTIALAPTDGRLAPFAVTFQQHNYLRTYLLAERDEPGRLSWPPDGRIAVDVAVRSNELYPHREGEVVRPAVASLDGRSLRYLIDGVARPWLAADDVTRPAVEIDPVLVYLPPSDAFYVFQGWLGERRRLPGRDGPPGADYNTAPALKTKVRQLAAFYWYEGNDDYLADAEALLANGSRSEQALQPFTERLARASGLTCAG
jgi:hypothetical protein